MTDKCSGRGRRRLGVQRGATRRALAVDLEGVRPLGISVVSRSYFLLTFLAAAMPHPVLAQLRGSVSDPAGQPIIGSVVSVYRGSAEIGRTSTGPRGAFAFSGQGFNNADALTVRAVGFRPQSRRWSPPDSVLHVTLEPFAAPLPEIVVPGLTIQCPTTDDPLARTLWSALRAKYDQTPQAVGLFVHMDWIAETAYANELGSIDESRLAESTGWAGRHGRARQGGYRRLVDAGYAVSLRDARGIPVPSTDRAYFEWWYPSFHRWQPDHFIEASFGQLQVLSLVRQGTSMPSIRFCSRDRRRPSVAGVLLLTEDTTLAEAAWEFHTPRPNEHAGGRAWYLPPSGSTEGPRYLLPSMSVFWRQRGGQKGLYFHDSAVYHGWRFGSGPEIPRVAR